MRRLNFSQKVNIFYIKSVDIYAFIVYNISIILQKRSDVMADLTFNSSLSEQQINDNFKNVDLFSGIMSGLEEVLEYEKGKASVGKPHRLPPLKN